MGALRGYAIIEGLCEFHAFAHHGGNLARCQQRAGIDRGRLGGRRMKLRRDQHHQAGGQQKAKSASIRHGGNSEKNKNEAVAEDIPNPADRKN
jgi:hypothetical protein